LVPSAARRSATAFGSASLSAGCVGIARARAGGHRDTVGGLATTSFLGHSFSPLFSSFVSLSRAQLQAPNPALCLLEQADYMECLHRNKLKRRIADKLVEAKRKEDGH
jgi:hypothetical protein